MKLLVFGHNERVCFLRVVFSKSSRGGGLHDAASPLLLLMGGRELDRAVWNMNKAPRRICCQCTSLKDTCIAKQSESPNLLCWFTLCHSLIQLWCRIE